METKEIRMKRFNDEINLLQDLHDKELVLRSNCKLENNRLDWNTICEVIMPNNPVLVKKRLLEYLGSIDMDKDELMIMDLLNRKFSSYPFDVRYYSGISSIINQYFRDKSEQFVDTMVDIYESMKDFNYSIGDVFKMAYIYYVNK